MICNMVFNLIFVYLLYDYDLGHAGLALATAASAWLNAGLLWFGLRRDGAWLTAQQKQGAIAPFLAGLSMAVFLVFLQQQFPLLWDGAGFADRAFHLTLYVVSGLVCYVVLVPLLGWRKHHLVAPK
jgi:putative peptidoglycan lipid II flippase